MRVRIESETYPFTKHLVRRNTLVQTRLWMNVHPFPVDERVIDPYSFNSGSLGCD